MKKEYRCPKCGEIIQIDTLIYYDNTITMFYRCPKCKHEKVMYKLLETEK